MPVCRRSIIASHEFLLDQHVLFGGQGPWQILVGARDVVSADQVGQEWNLLAPRQFLKDSTQTDHMMAHSHLGQRRLVGAQQSEPAQNVWVAAQLLEGAHAWMLRVQIVQKVARGALIVVRRVFAERSGERLCRSLKQSRQWMAGRGNSESHDWRGEMGRSRLATARVYCSTTSLGEI
jgi:hypothetical protein